MSTQAPEESAALDAYLAVRKECPNLRLILVPRHKERSTKWPGSSSCEVCRSFAAAGWLGSAYPPPPDSTPATAPILLLDTLGELSACWGLADVAFVGGSLTNRGGQNMIEPAGYGAAILFGPNTQNFRDVVELLLSNQAARVVRDAADLTTALSECLANPVRARAAGAALKLSSWPSRALRLARSISSRHSRVSSDLSHAAPLDSIKVVPVPIEY